MQTNFIIIITSVLGTVPFFNEMKLVLERSTANYDFYLTYLGICLT